MKDKNDSRYDAAHSADILFIVALNLLLWGGVAVLCATLEYNVKVNVCVSIKTLSVSVSICEYLWVSNPCVCLWVCVCMCVSVSICEYLWKCASIEEWTPFQQPASTWKMGINYAPLGNHLPIYWHSLLFWLIHTYEWKSPSYFCCQFDKIA